ncbi:ABC transporter substrate-binding protein [Bradyrhizobium sp. NP1]|uniref:ABC transporter substrate-binding protein n=1 Tax=Bradyrhizobium sp. NP1 TaxID=3049772 RepID=UPI0025A5FB2D|nr:ABC transporter substrate-binding protein [Bradyrhizobium sp. NP1]WJR77849.1 ABC transporter substrate-binding protein [Bradyrhizobium sp. NP1]
MNRANSAVAALLFLAAVAVPGAACAQTKVRFTLDWIPGATHGAFLIALQKGYYKQEGLDVTIDRGKGSAEVVRQLAADVYDMGFPDINVVMDFDSKNPEQSFPVLMSGYEEAPAAIVVLKSSGITEPKQLNGKKLGSAPNDSTFKLFPIFARKAGIDVASMEIQSIDPSLREVLLAQKKVDAIPGQIFNALLELKAKGVPASDIKYFMYKDYGLPLYANSIAASRRFLKEHPDAVRGFLRATLKGLKDMARDPELAVKAAVDFEPLLNPDIERERLRVALECCILTDTVRKTGFGDIDRARLDTNITEITEAYKLPRRPKLEEIFDPAYLPDAKDRLIN